MQEYIMLIAHSYIYAMAGGDDTLLDMVYGMPLLPTNNNYEFPMTLRTHVTWPTHTSWYECIANMDTFCIDCAIFC